MNFGVPLNGRKALGQRIKKDAVSCAFSQENAPVFGKMPNQIYPLHIS